MKTLKDFLENLITTANFTPSDGAFAGTNTPDGKIKKPSKGPQKVKRKKSKLKKKAKINKLEDMMMGDMQKRPTHFRIQPAVWENKE